MNDVSTRVLLSMAMVVTGVGGLDAFISREWDLLVVFVLSGIVQFTLWLRHRANRTPVSLRPDLSRWLERQSQRSGEPFDDVLDRAVAWYQHGLFADHRTEK
ncbi:MAG: hypothetical protein ACRBK7_19090 [Acidimicrobiales bacterium]